METVVAGEIVENASIDAVVMHVAEKMVGWRKRLGEYPTLSAISPAAANPVSKRNGSGILARSLFDLELSAGSEMARSHAALLQIFLMVFFGAPESACGCDLRGDGPFESAAGIERRA